MHLNAEKLTRAIQAYRQASKKTRRECVRQAAKTFLGGKSKGGARFGIIFITPPASKGVTGAGAKRQGESIIAGDLTRIFQKRSEKELQQFELLTGGTHESLYGHKGARPIGAIRAHVIRTLSEALAWHRRRRVRSTGRTLNVNRDVTTGHRLSDLAGLDIGLISPQIWRALIQTLFRRIGLLAAGWNSAAVLLRVAVPLWIKRHGESMGSHSITEGPSLFRLKISNDVEFVGNVNNYESRMDKALGYAANALFRQAAYLNQKALRESGL